jgi:hypothetical protein
VLTHDPILTPHCPLMPLVCDHCVVLLLDDLERAGAVLPTIREQLHGINASSVAWAQLHRLNASITDLQVPLAPPALPHPPSSDAHLLLPTEPAPGPSRPPPRDDSEAADPGTAEHEPRARLTAAGQSGRTLQDPCPKHPGCSSSQKTLTPGNSPETPHVEPLTSSNALHPPPHHPPTVLSGYPGAQAMPCHSFSCLPLPRAGCG